MKASPASIEKEIVKYLDDEGYEVISKACGAFFVLGEYSVMHRKLAITMPIPMYVYLGVKGCNTAGIYIKLNSYISGDVVGEKIVLVKKAKQQLLTTLSEIFHLDTAGIKIQALFSFPYKVGLNSSGAMSALMVLALQNLFDPKSCIFDVCETPVQDLMQDSTFKKRFMLARRVENVIHGPDGSGVGAFSSLVGSPHGTPLLYMKRSSPEKFTGCNISEILSSEEQKHLYDFIWKENLFLAVYSNEERRPTKEAVHLEEFDEK